jgi:hypothetical protein
VVGGNCEMPLPSREESSIICGLAHGFESIMKIWMLRVLDVACCKN